MRLLASMTRPNHGFAAALAAVLGSVMLLLALLSVRRLRQGKYPAKHIGSTRAGIAIGLAAGSAFIITAAVQAIKAL
jgi:hypothetical protein